MIVHSVLRSKLKLKNEGWLRLLTYERRNVAANTLTSNNFHVFILWPYIDMYVCHIIHYALIAFTVSSGSLCGSHPPFGKQY